MKELEKTQRLSIASVLTILFVLVGLISYKKPKHIYDINSKNTLEKVITNDYFVGFDKIDNPDFVLIDIRNQNEFNRGHLENAVNIYAPELLNDTNSNFFKELQKKDKTIVLYGNNPNETIAPFMLLYQLGYKNCKILTIKNGYFENSLITKNCNIESSINDIDAFIKESVKKASLLNK